jgi:hypothetical protein
VATPAARAPFERAAKLEKGTLLSSCWPDTTARGHGAANSLFTVLRKAIRDRIVEPPVRSSRQEGNRLAWTDETGFLDSSSSFAVQ